MLAETISLASLPRLKDSGGLMRSVYMVLLLLLLAWLVTTPAVAETKCVSLSNNVVVETMPCGISYDIPVTRLDTTDSRWTDYLAAQSNRSAAANYRATLATKLAQGIAITCTCTGYPNGTLDGTYSLTPEFLNTLQGLTLRAVGNRPITGSHGPNGGNTVPLYDRDGMAHSFDRTHILELADAVTDLQLSYSFQNVQANGWPASNAATIQ